MLRAVLVRRAKIVCTIGPACDDKASLEQLIRAGMDVARLNFSHGSHEEHARRFATIRAAAEACDKPVAILQDLCGPKIRAGRFPGNTRDVPADSDVVLVEEVKGALAEPGQIPIAYEGLAQDLQPGDVILLDDGRVAVTVKAIEGDRVRALVTQGGALRDRVGVSLPSRRVRIATLTEKDKADLNFGLGLGIDYVALSFVRHADDVRLVREITEAWGRPTPIVSKIETPSAIDNLEPIILASDAVMVARGDLGVEFNPERVPIIQREILGLARTHQRPAIVATEMLQSMVTATRPTRAEASDVATAVFEGSDAVMLSQETATGAHPALVVRTMAAIVMEAEQSKFYRPLSSERPGERANVSEAVARNACDIARDIGARCIVAFTESGLSARYASKARPNVPIIAFSPNATTRRRLALMWGVVPLPIDSPRHPDEMVDHVVMAAEDGRLLRAYADVDLSLADGMPALMWGVVPLPIDSPRHPDEMVDRANALLLANGFVSPGDKFVAIYGAPVGVVGTTNAIRVRVVE